jgi:predicted ester cyclase
MGGKSNKKLKKSLFPVQKFLLNCINNKSPQRGRLFKQKCIIMKTAEQIWSAYMQSTSEQNEIWKDLIDEDITFTGPVRQVKGKEAYIKTTEDFFRMVRNFELKRYVANDNLLVTEVELTVAAPSGKEIILDMAEFYETGNDQIRSVKVHYDATEFRKEFGMDS